MSLPPVLVVGMHRSGTSLLARMLQQLGLHLGDELVPADRHNPDGYGEDSSFVELQRHLLARGTPVGHEGWPDWGWSDRGGFTVTHRNTAALLQAHRSAAQHLLGQRARMGLWGWKDPRTTLLLPFWQELAPQSSVIGIYRHPWEVVDALQRLQPPVFLAHPHWALPIWLHYNRALLAHQRRHPERTLLINSAALLQHPAALAALFSRRFGWSISREAADRLATLPRPGLHRSPAPTDPLPLLHRLVSPEATAVLEQLERCADLPSPLPAADPARLHLPPHGCSAPPRLAIVIPTHNQGDLLIEAIASAERHVPAMGTPAAVELQIVDDGSSQPRSLEVLNGLEALGYRVLRQANQGLAAARNAGINATTAPLLLPLDDDNQLLAAYLSQGVPLLEQHQQLAVLYGDRQDFGLQEALVRPGADAPRQLRRINRIDACALLRRHWWARVGGYDTSLTAFEDWDLWLGISRAGGRYGYLAAPAFRYRIRPNSMLQRHLGSRALADNQVRRIRMKHQLDTG